MELNVRKKLKKINIGCNIIENEPMSDHTTFRTGGTADLYCIPESVSEISSIISFCRKNSVPWFILGEGANILVSDRGIRGIVIDMKNFSSLEFDGSVCISGSGKLISDTARESAKLGFSGLEFIYAMPGTVGGAIWMNARCYGKSISDVLTGVTFLDDKLELRHLDREAIERTFSYKKSFFQGAEGIILKGEFTLGKKDRDKIEQTMSDHRIDRENKGHFLYPSAGSVFKNNRAWGKPTGVILEELGLKGQRRGDAQIAEYHGNIIINRGNATSGEIKELINLCCNEAESRLGIKLEAEVQLIGEW